MIFAVGTYDFPNLTPLAPLSARGEGGEPAPRTACSPSPFTERGMGVRLKRHGKTRQLRPK